MSLDLPESFSYQAQGDDGHRMSGTIEAPDAEAAMTRLQALRLRVTEIAPLAKAANGKASSGNGGPVNGKALRGEDFVAFNQQLAQLTKAGLPVEHGLRLIAGDVRRGRLARTINQVADELERGTPLGEAFDKHRGQFPSLYGRLIGAGVRSGNLPGVLLNLGRHLELEQRLRGTLWRTLAYPLTVFVGLCLVLMFLGTSVLPQFEQIFKEFAEAQQTLSGVQWRWMGGTPPPPPALPAVTQGLLVLADFAPVLLGLVLLVVVGGPILWVVLKWTGKDRAAIDRFALPLPLVGPVLRLNLVARWCDALRLGVDAGLDLPAAVDLAGDATNSPALRKDGRALVERLQSGKPLSGVRGRVLPATVPVAMDLASGHHDLPSTLETLSEMYQRQAESRIAALPAFLTPLLVIIVASVTAFVIAGLLVPLARALQSFV